MKTEDNLTWHISYIFYLVGNAKKDVNLILVYTCWKGHFQIKAKISYERIGGRQIPSKLYQETDYSTSV